VEHQYKPPDKFIKAVIAGPLPESVECQAIWRKFEEQEKAYFASLAASCERTKQRRKSGGNFGNEIVGHVCGVTIRSVALQARPAYEQAA
jgi:hypothetical protein